jgi:hypothetical protein
MKYFALILCLALVSCDDDDDSISLDDCIQACEYDSDDPTNDMLVICADCQVQCYDDRGLNDDLVDRWDTVMNAPDEEFGWTFTENFQYHDNTTPCIDDMKNTTY